MTTTTHSTVRLLVALAIVAVSGACASNEDTTPSGLGATQLTVSADTVAGTGELAELQQRRAAWLARGIDDYHVQLQIVCFCAGDIRRPVLMEVRKGALTKVWDLETGRIVSDISPYPTITTLFDRAVETRSGGGHVSVAYDATQDFPTRIEIGTLANDAGTMYMLGALRPL
jgi:hypothetical protein